MEKLAEEAINDQDDPLKNLATEELEETINELREILLNEVPEELNAQAFRVKVSERLIIQNSVLNNIFHSNMSI